MDYDILEEQVAIMLDQPVPRHASVVINDDGTVAFDPGEEWQTPRRKSRGNPLRQPVLVKRTNTGLMGCMAPSNCEHANTLGRGALAAVLLAVAKEPFPLGNGEAVYRACLTSAETAYTQIADTALSGRIRPHNQLLHAWLTGLDKDFPDLGPLRKAIVDRAGTGCNAPVDSYLRIAYHIVRGEDVPRREGY
jgi:hypothetical protein